MVGGLGETDNFLSKSNVRHCNFFARATSHPIHSPSSTSSDLEALTSFQASGPSHLSAAHANRLIPYTAIRATSISPYSKTQLEPSERQTQPWRNPQWERTQIPSRNSSALPWPDSKANYQKTDTYYLDSSSLANRAVRLVLLHDL